MKHCWERERELVEFSFMCSLEYFLYVCVCAVLVCSLYYMWVSMKNFVYNCVYFFVRVCTISCMYVYFCLKYAPRGSDLLWTKHGCALPQNIGVRRDIVEYVWEKMERCWFGKHVHSTVFSVRCSGDTRVTAGVYTCIILCNFCANF